MRGTAKRVDRRLDDIREAIELNMEYYRVGDKQGGGGMRWDGHAV